MESLRLSGMSTWISWAPWPARNGRDLLEKDLTATRNLFKTSGTDNQDELNLKELEFQLADAELNRIKQTEMREEVEYQMALAQQAMRKLSAPAAGEVTRMLIDPGEYISTEQPLLRLVDTRKCVFLSNLSAEEVGRVAVGKALSMEFNHGDASFQMKGKVIFVSPVTDAASGLRLVKLELKNADQRVSPGTRGYLLLD